MTTIDWGGTDKEVKRRMGAYGKASKQALKGIADFHAPQIETDGKRNAPWIDRTANARQTLHSFAEHDDERTAIVFAHGVEYGVFLELANQGRFAIIAPTLQAFYPRVWRMVKAVFE